MYLSSLIIWLTREILDLKNEWCGGHNFYVMVWCKMKRHGYCTWGTHLKIQTKCVVRHMRGTYQNIKMRHLNAWLLQLWCQGTAYAFRAFNQYRYHSCRNYLHILLNKSIGVMAQKKQHGSHEWCGINKEINECHGWMKILWPSRRKKNCNAKVKLIEPKAQPNAQQNKKNCMAEVNWKEGKACPSPWFQRN